MRTARRWTDEDLRSLDEQRHGLISTSPISLSPEAAEIRLAKIRATRAKLESLFEQHLTWTGMRSAFEKHVRFFPGRKWELDYLAAPYKLAVEIHGGVFSAGRHTTGTGFTLDRVKMNAAAEMGITVLEFTGEMLQDASAIAQTERVLRSRGWNKT